MCTYLIEKLKDRNVRLTVALAIGLLSALLCCGMQMRMQHRLSGKLLRLHVVANSDRAEDQQLKLAVRDAVLACRVGRVPTLEELKQVECAARDCLRAHGCSDRVQVSYTRMYFDTKEYADFALPAGSYQALRVVIGEGKGKNWWCVVYPALCTDLAEGEQELSEEELAFIKKDGKKFLIRFRISEIISEVAYRFSGE